MDPILFILLLELGIAAVLLLPVYMGAVLLRRGEYARALPWFQWCYRVSRVLRHWRGIMACNLCACYLGLGDYATALPYAEEAVAETSKKGHRQSVRHTARAYLGIILARMGQFERAEALFTEVLESKRLTARLRRMVELYAANGYLNWGRLDEAERLAKGVIAEEKSATDTLLMAACCLSACHYYRGDLNHALEVARRAAGSETKTEWVRAVALANCLLYQAELGEVDEAKKVAESLGAMLPRLTPQVQAPALRAMSRLALQQGDLDRARSLAERAYPLDPGPNNHAASLLLQAEVFAARHNPNRVTALCDEILRLPAMTFYKERAEALRRQIQGEPLALETATFTPPALVPEEPAVQQILRID